jgi:hypothetical protein
MAEPTPTALDIQALPKISLHDHLDGGLRPATILEIAEAEGVLCPSTTQRDHPLMMRAVWVNGSQRSLTLVPWWST